jgi:phosphopantetheinyl transferase
LADASTGVHFSLAHSGDHVLVAVTRAGPVGVDVEQLKPMTDYRRLDRTTLTADEAAALRAAGGRPLAFLGTWVRKEAVTKAVGTGMATPQRDVRITEHDGSQRPPRRGRCRPRVPPRQMTNGARVPLGSPLRVGARGPRHAGHMS